MRLHLLIATVVPVAFAGCVVGIDPPAPTEAVFIKGNIFPFGSEVMCFNASQTEQTCDSSLTNLPKTWPVVKVHVDDFLIDSHEVTNRQYDYCVQMGNCELPEYNNITSGEIYYGNPIYDNYPVVNVTFDMAEKYCEFVGGRLPNEVEWERAAGGPSTVDNPKRILPTDKVTYTRLRSCGSKPVGISVKWCTSVARPAQVTKSVDDYVTDSVGGPKIFDLAGNVAEWTIGRYRENVTCADDLPQACDCWACGAADGVCKEDCYTTCTACSNNQACYVQCENEASHIGLPVCIAYSGPVEISEVVDLTSSVGDRVIKGGNYSTENSRTCEMTVSYRGRHISKADSAPTVGFRCVYDASTESVSE